MLGSPRVLDVEITSNFPGKAEAAAVVVADQGTGEHILRRSGRSLGLADSSN